MKRVAVVDYGLCNLDSIARALEECGANVVVTADPAELLTCDRAVVPGVGSFRDAMVNLRSGGLADAVTELATVQRAPVLGICLGMQLLASRGEEGGPSDGLGLVPGKIVRLVPTSADPRVPHIGWNEVHPTATHPLFGGIRTGADFYFVHSFHFVADEPAAGIASTPYCGGFASVVARENVMGVQFHPEKSQRVGFQLLRNFLAF